MLFFRITIIQDLCNGFAGIKMLLYYYISPSSYITGVRLSEWWGCQNGVFIISEITLFET